MSALQSLRSQYEKYEDEQLLGGAEPLAELSKLAEDCTELRDAQTVAVAYALKSFLFSASSHISDRPVRRTEGNAVMKHVQNIVPQAIEFMAAGNDDPSKGIEIITKMCEIEREILNRRDK